MTAKISTTVAALVVVASIAFGVGPGIAAANDHAPFAVSIDAPDDLSTDGNQTIAVTVTNNESTDLLNPVVEVPISSPFSLASGAEDAVYVNNTSDVRDAQVSDSTFTTGDAIVINGEVVPAGESRTYHFNVTLSSAGSTSLTADVRPLYNTQNNERVTTTLDVSGVGTVDANIQGNSSAAVVIDSADKGADSVSETVLEGTHTVTANFPNAPEFEVGVGISETQSVTFVEGTNDIQEVAYTGNAPSHVGNSTSETDGNATTPVNATVTFTFSKSSGTTVFDISAPDKPLRGVGDASSGANIISQSELDGDKRVRLNQTGAATQVTVEFEGYELGNADLDSDVDASDASTIAENVSNDNSADYGDVNGDGQVNAVDAMLVQQYADGNRDADYTLSGGP
ncbi:dockerin type I domain-containing protein [Haloferax sp. S1W]|uniref:dockerin type I domain-containing protein n=1 Tax=Haloferax sp. S1W TaxID=3377110 RepID=UPI0037CB81CF